MIATILFGITPAVGKLTYAMGNNGVQLAFFKTSFCIATFFSLLLFIKGNLFRLKQITMVRCFQSRFFFGNTLTIVMLYSSYEYIGVGSATVLHFFISTFLLFV